MGILRKTRSVSAGWLAPTPMEAPPPPSTSCLRSHRLSSLVQLVLTDGPATYSRKETGPDHPTDKELGVRQPEMTAAATR